MNFKKEIISGRKLLERLNSENWSALIPQLHYYAFNKLDRYNFLHDSYNVKNLSTHFADEAIRMVWEEERKWNLNYYKEIFPFLKGIVDSLISNFIKSKEVELTEALPEDDYNTVANGSDPESDYIAKEIEAEIAGILASDSEAFDVFDCLKSGLKPSEISEELDLDIKQVYNVIKRVKRKLNDYYIKLKTQ